MESPHKQSRIRNKSSKYEYIICLLNEFPIIRIMLSRL